MPGTSCGSAPPRRTTGSCGSDHPLARRARLVDRLADRAEIARRQTDGRRSSRRARRAAASASRDARGSARHRCRRPGGRRTAGCARSGRAAPRTGVRRAPRRPRPKARSPRALRASSAARWSSPGSGRPPGRSHSPRSFSSSSTRSSMDQDAFDGNWMALIGRPYCRPERSEGPHAPSLLRIEMTACSRCQKKRPGIAPRPFRNL